MSTTGSFLLGLGVFVISWSLFRLASDLQATAKQLRLGWLEGEAEFKRKETPQKNRSRRLNQPRL